MATPRKKAPPPPRWHRWIENRAVLAAALLTLFSLVSFAFGTTRDLTIQAWRHYTGAELAFTLAPQVQELRDLQVQQAPLLNATLDRISQGEKRLLKAEKTLEAANVSKAIEQEREGAVEKAQRSACLTRELSEDACHRLGYPTEQK